MNKKLIIETGLNETYFKLAGLSIKAVKGCYNFGQDIYYVDYLKLYSVNNRFITDPKTATIKYEKLLEYLTELIEVIPFTKIEFIGYYTYADKICKALKVELINPHNETV